MKEVKRHGSSLMKVDRKTADLHRRQIVDAAGRLYRRQGPAGVSLAEVMREAGLTHGGFYGHFDSKDELVGTAAETALDAATARLDAAADAAGPAAWNAVAAAYLSPQHREDCERGCAIAALAGDVARMPESVQARFVSGLGRYLHAAERLTGSRDQALADVALMAGAIAMARAVGKADSALGDEILAAARKTIAKRGR